MAARQGLTAQLHQYSEDTKRSLLRRAPAGIQSHSWLSNLNTTCTIKSAPPRTPEVMSLLGVRSGWLAKRNEQHVWQRRWCVVVPHTFLYYFDASPVPPPGKEDADDDIPHSEAWSGGGVNTNAHVAFANLDQEALNTAVKDGYEEGGGAGGGLYSALPTLMRGSAAPPPDGLTTVGEDAAGWDGEAPGVHGPLSPAPGGPYPHPNPHADDALTAPGAAPNGRYPFASSNLQPVGIIDLECYTAVNRSGRNPTVVELAGDRVTNPDLRSFYFQAPSVEDAEGWTTALLGERHGSLKDETEAYRQVCDSFPLQLANCSAMIDEAERRAEEKEREAYTVRSEAEEGRRRVVEAVREVLERECWEADAGGVGPEPADPWEEGRGLAAVLGAHGARLEAARAALLRELDTGASSPAAGAVAVVAPVQTLADYAAALAEGHADLRVALRQRERDRGQSSEEDQARLDAMRDAVAGRNKELEVAERRHSAEFAECRAARDEARRQAEELERQLEAQRLEFSMYQNATKGKMGELQQHKKVLKREVIELRKKVDECGSESHTVAHEYGKVQSALHSVKDRNSTLERYIERLEKQVGVQQNMMEMVSQTGGGASFVGKMVGPGVSSDVGGARITKVTGPPHEGDGASLSGMSLGSQGFRRLHPSLSNLSMGGVPKSRQLLPPEARGPGRHAAHSASPLPTPRFTGYGAGPRPEGGSRAAGGVDNRQAAEHDQGEDDRDPSTAYNKSETTSPGSGEDGGDAVPSSNSSGKDQQRTSNRKQQSSPSQDDGKGSLKNKIDLPLRSPDDRNEQPSQQVEASRTPVQSNNSFTDNESSCEKVTRGMSNDEEKLKIIPSLDTNGEKILNVNTSIDDDDDLDDNASRVSDITEDRTQRQIDDDLAERRKILLAYVNKSAHHSSASLSHASTQRRLETIENLTPERETDGDAMGLDSSMAWGSMSVAQRARLAAENQSNTHRTPSPTARAAGEAAAASSGGDTSLPHPQAGLKRRPPQGPVRQASSADSSSAGDTVSRSGSFWTRMGTAIEKAVDNSVLGVPLDREVGRDDSYHDECASIVATSVASEASTTLAERIALQRGRQRAFLKHRGLIDDDGASLRGGGTGGSVTGASHPKTPAPKRTLAAASFAARWSPQKIAVAQDEV